MNSCDGRLLFFRYSWYYLINAKMNITRTCLMNGISCSQTSEHSMCGIDEWMSFSSLSTVVLIKISFVLHLHWSSDRHRLGNNCPWWMCHEEQCFIHWQGSQNFVEVDFLGGFSILCWIDVWSKASDLETTSLSVRSRIYCSSSTVR